MKKDNTWNSQGSTSRSLSAGSNDPLTSLDLADKPQDLGSFLFEHTSRIPLGPKFIVISTTQQKMTCFEHDQLIASYPVSTGKNGVGEVMNSQCTPRGWHKVHSILGLTHEPNSVFVARQWTGELYSEELAQKNPGRDWILTRILQLDGLEPGRNQGGVVDTLSRYIYIHGTPDSTQLGTPGSHGCIRMSNADVITLAQWARIDSFVYIQ